MKRHKKTKRLKIIKYAPALFLLMLSSYIINSEKSVEVLNKEEESFIKDNFIEEEKEPPPSPPLYFPQEEEEEEDAPDAALPDVPEEFKKPMREADLSYKDRDTFLHTHGISLKNATQFSDEEISALLDTPMKMRFKKTDKPQFLIYHTHATESFNPADRPFYDSRYNWRSRDNTINMVSVGNETLKELDGIAYIHDTSQHDYPSYNGSYKNSFDSVSAILKENSEIKVALDLHRDAIQNKEGLITKPVLILPDGKKVAQIMIIANCDDGSGLIPNWRENFRFAKEIYLSLDKICPGIARPILLSHRKYNQQLSTGSLLIEVGGHANTLSEAKRAGKILGLALKDIYENFQE